jgi:ribose/xylose/arabinose/galactoside ABC-type transport system permease subunit
VPPEIRPDGEIAIEPDHAAVSEVVGNTEHTIAKALIASQPFWVTVALFVLILFMVAFEPTFGTSANIGNIARNFAPFGIMALGMTMVIITGGIDLSVGSVMGLVVIVAGLFLTWEYPWYVAFAMGQGYELRVIAATVIGGANLMGGAGTAYGAVIGSALLEVIRNALLMAGIDSNWQGAFVGAFIVLAVLLGMLTADRSLVATVFGNWFQRKHR